METILSNTEIYKDGIFTVNLSQIDFWNGNTGKFEYISSSSNTGTWVLVVPMDTDDNVLLVEQFQIGANKRLLVLPRGGIEEWVPIEVKVNEELQEEIGYKSNKLTRLTEIDTFPGWHKAKSYLYLAQDLQISQKPWDELETVQVHKIPFYACIEKIMKGEITDSRTIAGIFFTKEYLKL